MMATLPEQLLTQDLDKEDIQRHQWEDPWCKSLLQFLAAGILPDDEALRDRMRFVAENYVVRDAILYHLWWADAKGRLEPREQVVIPVALQDSVIRHYCHNDYTGHAGRLCTYQRARQHFYWPGLYSSIEDFVKRCSKCQQHGRAPAEVVTHKGTSYQQHTWRMMDVRLLASKR